MCADLCVCVDVNLLEFWEPDVFNYTTLLLSEERGVLYVGAREVVYQLNMSNVSIKSNQVRMIPNTAEASFKDSHTAMFSPHVMLN